MKGRLKSEKKQSKKKGKDGNCERNITEERHEQLWLMYIFLFLFFLNLGTIL